MINIAIYILAAIGLLAICLVCYTIIDDARVDDMCPHPDHVVHWPSLDLSNMTFMGIPADDLCEMIERLDFARDNGGALSLTDDGYRLDPESETLFLCARPTKGGAE